MNEIQEKISEVSQNTVKLADKIFLEYMQKKGLTIDDLQADYFSMKNEIRELKQKNADLRFKNAELCEELFKLTRK